MRETSAGAGKDNPYKDSPRRYIDKREGVRHVLHAAIRAVLSGEDPFAIHLLGQSAEKVLIDLLENEGVEDPLFSLLKPDMRSEFFNIYRESYNFLKHADRDSDGKLGVRNIVGSNDLLLFTCILRYGVLFGSYTQHMSIFLRFAGLLYPGIVDWAEKSTQRSDARPAHSRRTHYVYAVRDATKPGLSARGTTGFGRRNNRQ